MTQLGREGTERGQQRRGDSTGEGTAQEGFGTGSSPGGWGGLRGQDTPGTAQGPKDTSAAPPAGLQGHTVSPGQQLGHHIWDKQPRGARAEQQPISLGEEGMLWDTQSGVLCHPTASERSFQPPNLHQDTGSAGLCPMGAQRECRSCRRPRMMQELPKAGKHFLHLSLRPGNPLLGPPAET